MGQRPAMSRHYNEGAKFGHNRGKAAARLAYFRLTTRNYLASKQKPADSELPNRPVEKLSDSARPGRDRGVDQLGWDDGWVIRM